MLIGYLVSMSGDSVLTGLLNFITYGTGELFDFLVSLDPQVLFVAIYPYLNLVVVGAAAILVFEAVIKGAIQTGEAFLVTLLYLLGLPGIILGCLFVKRRSRLAEDAERLAAGTAQQEKAPLLLDLRLFRRLSWREEQEEELQARLSPEQKVDTALIELGVPLSATDEEIRRAYRKLVLDNHPDLMPRAPAATRERARKMTMKIRCAYDTAMGRRLATPES